MDSRYEHAQHEQKTYHLWEAENAFSPDAKGIIKKSSNSKKPFTIVMPPPNANDPLHVGHAMFISLEDVLIRYHRMLGDDTLWLPGTDHAGIETQYVFEKKLQKQGKSRFDYDRETLYQMIWDYVQENSEVAKNQMKKIGASADWSRFLFMLDPRIVETVLETFFKLHHDGLLYRDLKLVNYCTKCGTSYSDLEVDHVEQKNPLYYVKYPLADKPSEFITVATVRPEPVWADTHLAVNPNDPTKKHLIGQEVLNPLTNATMTIIADEYVDPEFGTGIVKLTPAHDPNDFELAQKHGLPIVVAITPQGKIAVGGGTYAGLSVVKAREEVVKDLTEKGLIEKIDTNYTNRIGVCYRCGRVIEPLPLPQFFIKVKPLAEAVLAKQDAGEFKVYGAGHDKILKHWLENLKDWNISRQIVWGIRFPVWYEVPGHEADINITFIDSDKKIQQGTLEDLLRSFSLAEIKAGLQNLNASASVPYSLSLSEPEDSDHWIQETDTFDTWFSSAQWPFSTLQALDKDTTTSPSNFERFYPTAVMETGYDILPFWVMRMLMMGLYATGKLPFTDVYLHGLVRDSKGQKMSKSKGNVVNPLEVIEKYGADALRMALVIRSSAGLDKSVGEADFKAMRNFTNKIWNAARFVKLMNEEGTESQPDPALDTAFFEKLTQVSQDITQQLNDFKIGLAAETAYNEFWHWFCDECIENAKQGQLSHSAVLKGLVTWLKLLHPFTPFVTEAIWHELQQAGLLKSENELLVASSWPTSHN